MGDTAIGFVTDPNQVAADIAKAGDAWAEVDHAARLLEQTKAAVFARIKLRIKDELGCKIGEAHERALASDEYQDHLHALCDARYAANLARVKFDAEKARFDASRTAEASRREEMKAFGRT
jgi:hypothetical protein